MAGEKNLQVLIKNMKPELIEGDYVFVTVNDDFDISQEKIISFFREKEGVTLILKKKDADILELAYDSVMKWITLNIHSSLDAVGLTAAFSNALAQEEISCNVVAGFYHDHIFVGDVDAEKAMKTLLRLSQNF